jgi:hypothetical protein
MTTIEIFYPQSAQTRLLKRLMTLIPQQEMWHFMREDESFVIRLTTKASADKVCAYLKKRKLLHRHYSYPFGKGYGEGRRGVVYRHFAYFQGIFWFNSVKALQRDKKDDLNLIERQTHTLINQFGYSWVEEAAIHLRLAKGRIGVIRRYESRSLASELVCTLLMKSIGGIIKLLNLLL